MRWIRATSEMLVHILAYNHAIADMGKIGERAYAPKNTVSFTRIAMCDSLLGWAPWLDGELIIEAGYSQTMRGLRRDVEGVVHAVLTKPPPPANPSSPPFMTQSPDNNPDRV